MAYGTYKDVPRRTVSDKVLRDKSYAIASNPKYNGYQQRVASMFYKFFDKKSNKTTTHTRAGIISEDQQLANKLHRHITRKFTKRKIYSSINKQIQ